MTYKPKFRFESRTRWVGFRVSRLRVEKAHRWLGHWIARCDCGNTVRTTGERLVSVGVQCCPVCHKKNWLEGAKRKQKSNDKPITEIARALDAAGGGSENRGGGGGTKPCRSTDQPRGRSLD